MPVKRALLVLTAALILLNTLVLPSAAHADEAGTGNCGKTICKP
jgi:hypothetical protein